MINTSDFTLNLLIILTSVNEDVIQVVSLPYYLKNIKALYLNLAKPAKKHNNALSKHRVRFAGAALHRFSLDHTLIAEQMHIWTHSDTMTSQLQHVEARLRGRKKAFE